MGAALTIILVGLLSMFSMAKLWAWKKKSDVDIMGAIVENAYDYSYKFGAE